MIEKKSLLTQLEILSYILKTFRGRQGTIISGRKSMDSIALDNITFQLGADDLAKKLHLRKDSPHVNDLNPLIREAQIIGKPKALYKVAFIESKGDDYVTVDGIMLKSRVLRVNLDQAYRIFPYAVTCGLELEDWTNDMTDLLQRYWAGAIKETILLRAIDFLKEHLIEYYQLGQVSRMSPGSLSDWPIQEQRPLFAILGNTRDLIGVHLTEGLMMVPTKSVSGILFPTEINFVSCQLCPREVCPGRKATYDKDLYDRKYRLK